MKDSELQFDRTCHVPDRHIVPGDRGNGGKSDSPLLPQAEICGLQQAVFQEAHV